MKLCRFPAAALALAVLAACSGATENDENAVRGVVDRFVATVNAADADAFVTFFTPDAIAFFPSSGVRRQGVEQIRQAIQPAFAQGPRNPPVQVTDLVVTVRDNLAVASFDAGSGTMHARRTLVLQQLSGEWKIIHLHASNVVD